MIGWLKDLPDWATGALAAGALWYGASYVVLAPRAMENHMEREVYPPCVAMLEQEQERAVSAARERFEQQRNRAGQALRAEEARLRQLDAVSGMYRGMGMTELMGALGAPVQMFENEAATIRQNVERGRAALAATPNFETTLASREELLRTCSCAGLQAAAGKRASYALSLASFRLIETRDIEAAKQNVIEIVGTNACGPQPWRTLS